MGFIESVAEIFEDEKEDDKKVMVCRYYIFFILVMY